MVLKNVSGKIKGITLLETLIVVAVSLTFMAMVLGLYRKLSGDMNARFENENILHMYKKLSVIYKDSGSGSLDNEFAIESGVVPKNMLKNGEDIRHSWKDSVVITGNKARVGSFKVTYYNVPAGFYCNRLVGKQSRVGWDNAIVGVKVDYANFKVNDSIKACAESTINKGYVDISFQKNMD